MAIKRGIARLSPNSTPAIDKSWKPTPSDLMQAIESTVDAKWESKGGEETMHWLGSSLLITAYPDRHTMVKRLLELLQTRWNASVTLETRIHWLWLSFSEEEKLSQLMVSSDASPVRSMDSDALKQIYRFRSHLDRIGFTSRTNGATLIFR